jgi:hypothetical protein
MGAKRDRIIYVDDDEYVWCSIEKDFVINTRFDINSEGEYKMFCIDCLSKTYEERNRKYIEGSNRRRQLDIEESRLLLRNLGYDTDGQYSIHEQFLMKHNLVK